MIFFLVFIFYYLGDMVVSRYNTFLCFVGCHLGDMAVFHFYDFMTGFWTHSCFNTVTLSWQLKLFDFMCQITILATMVISVLLFYHPYQSAALHTLLIFTFSVIS